MVSPSPIQAAQPAAFELTRVFNAPRDVVFGLWTTKSNLERWWCPRDGAVILFQDSDFRVDGVLRVGMVNADGEEVWSKWIYEEIVVPERIVFRNSFTDRDGNPAPAPLSPDWPRQMRTAFTFTEEGSVTRLSMHAAPLDGTPVEVATFAANMHFMPRGWGMTLDQLEKEIAREQEAGERS